MKPGTPSPPARNGTARCLAKATFSWLPILRSARDAYANMGRLPSWDRSSRDPEQLCEASRSAKQPF